MAKPWLVRNGTISHQIRKHLLPQLFNCFRALWPLSTPEWPSDSTNIWPVWISIFGAIQNARDLHWRLLSELAPSSLCVHISECRRVQCLEQYIFQWAKQTKAILLSFVLTLLTYVLFIALNKPIWVGLENPNLMPCLDSGCDGVLQWRGGKGPFQWDGAFMPKVQVNNRVPTNCSILTIGKVSMAGM